MNVCFSGGGIKGYAYIGVMRYFEEKGIVIKRLSGSSIGALMCLLINLDYTSKELEHLVLNLDLNILEDVYVKDFFTSYAISRGTNIKTLIRFLLSYKKHDKNITFKELYEKTGRHLMVCACNISDYSQQTFDYINFPDLEIYIALKASMNIPFIWEPEIIRGNMYIDGCFARNIPIELLPVENTIGFYLKTNKSNQIPDKIHSYAKKIITCLLHRSSSLEIENYLSKGYKLVDIDTYHVNAISVDIHNDDIQILIKSGYNKVKNLFL